MHDASSNVSSLSARNGSASKAAGETRNLEFLFRIFRLLGDPTRLNILIALAEGESNVTSLCEKLGLPQPTVSHHLGLMRMSRLIDNRRNGKQVFYALGDDVDVADDGRVNIHVDGHEVAIRFAKEDAGKATRRRR